jgi:hypothetical protein
MTAATSPPLSLTYLGGCPGHSRTEVVDVTVFDGYFELRARGWGWRIGFDHVVRVGEAQPSPTGDGQMVPIVWTPPGGGEPTLMLGGKDAVRLRFLLARAVAEAQFARANVPPAPPPRLVGRAPSAWQRELRRMRAVALAALSVALVALVLVFGVAFVVIGRGNTTTHWQADRRLIEQRAADLQAAQDRGDGAATATALQALVSACQALQQYNNDVRNQGDDFAATRRVCEDVGVVLE